MTKNSDLYTPLNHEVFRNKLASIVPLLEEYLLEDTPRGVKMSAPGTLYQKARELMMEGRGSEPDNDLRFQDIVKLYLDTGLFVHSTGSLGRQYSGNIPMAALMDMVNSIANQPASFYEASQLPCVAEKIMGEELNRFVGYDPNSFVMLQTSGGSLANLTALLAARNNHYANCSKTGIAGLRGIRPAIAMSEDAHYSLIRAVNMLGIGREGIVWLPLDRLRRIDAEKVPRVLNEAREKGMDVFCISCSAGSTPIGAIDPLEMLAHIAHQRGIWLHVDGCHGASLLLSDDLRKKLHGVEQADSLSWDAHKMLFMPSPCSLLFYKDRRRAALAFQESASYVKSDFGEEYGNGELNFECTKRPSVMNLWATWAIYGKELFANRIERLCMMCTDAWKTLCRLQDFEPLHIPEMNILCFRYIPKERPCNMTDNDFQVAIREEVCKRGRFFISKTKLGDTIALRMVIMNDKHTADTFMQLLEEIRSVGKDIINR